VRRIQPEANEVRNHQILFPMVVGVIFLAMLVVGALSG
jgi:hypothetical protein